MITGLNTYIKIGTIEMYRVPELKIISHRQYPLTRMEITLPDPGGTFFRTLRPGTPISVILGYRDQAQALWEGTLLKTSTGHNIDQIIVKAVGPEKPLSEIMIKQSFYRETPEAIVKYAINQAGLSPGRIDSPGVIFPRFVASNIPAWQVARLCEQTCKKAYDVDMRHWALWMGKDKKVNWGPFDEAADMPVIENNANLIRHSPGNNNSELSRIETFMLPHLMHSMKFWLKDIKRGIEADLRAIKVVHVLKDTRARTFISYGEAYGRY
ncbi:MAG: hypothetical protein GY710_12150 [Desulfobacteraceae bacterium]|nr:hypothetical protein [Desulfobacteraceae bacterium]